MKTIKPICISKKADVGYGLKIKVSPNLRTILTLLTFIL